MSLIPLGFWKNKVNNVITSDLILSLDASTHTSGNTTWQNLVSGGGAVNLYYGGATYNQSNTSLLPQKSSSYGGSVFFSRANSSFAETFLPVTTSTPVITVEFWGVMESSASGAWFLFGFFVNKLYGVYQTNPGLGFNTGVNDVYGFDGTRRTNVGSTLKPNHYVFIMHQTTSYTNGAIYVNGVKSLQFGYMSGSFEQVSNRTFGDGRFTINGSTDNYFGDYYVGEFRVYSRALTESEIIQNYSARNTRYGRPAYKPRVSGSNLQVYYDFAEQDGWYGNDGGYVTDFSQRMEWGSMGGGVAWDSGGGGNMQFRTAAQRQILLMLASNNIGIYYGSATFCFIVRMLDFTQNPAIIFHPTDTMIEGRGPQISTLSNASFQYSHGSANPPNTLANYGALSANTWYHVAMSYNYDTYTVKIYINGQPVVTNGFQERQVSVHGYWIGRNPGQYYTFDLGLFMAWAGVRSDSEILEQYNYNKTRFGLP